MKPNSLSNFQKEQYTQYLETQLENLSAFMLSQKKENEKFKLWESTIAKQNEKIHELEAKINLL